MLLLNPERLKGQNKEASSRRIWPSDWVDVSVSLCCSEMASCVQLLPNLDSYNRRESWVLCVNQFKEKWKPNLSEVDSTLKRSSRIQDKEDPIAERWRKASYLRPPSWLSLICSLNSEAGDLTPLPARGRGCRWGFRVGLRTLSSVCHWHVENYRALRLSCVTALFTLWPKKWK